MFGECFPPDYVFAGATVVYTATVPGLSDTTWWGGGIAASLIAARWTQAANQVKASAAAHYSVQGFEVNASSGSILVRLAVGGDMGSLQDVKATMDGAVKGAGFKLMASLARFINNPRRDGCEAPTTGPGKVYSKESGNIDTPKPTNWLDTTVDFYFGGLAKTLRDATGIPDLNSKTVGIGIIAAVAGAIFLLTRGR